jgi:hypothetical protein
VCFLSIFCVLWFLYALYLGLALLGFDDFPVAEDFGGVFSALFAEDVRVAANHFFIDFADDVSDGEAAFFASNLRVKEDLEKEVAQFFGEFGVVGAFKRIENFVSFFDEIGAEGGVSLLAVPRAAAGGTEARHESHELFEGGTDGGGARVSRCGLGAFGSFSLTFPMSHKTFSVISYQF